jgi:hypothetical protein
MSVWTIGKKARRFFSIHDKPVTFEATKPLTTFGLFQIFADTNYR